MAELVIEEQACSANSWVGLPLVSDLRALYYIKPSFINLSMTQPPPSGSWAVPSGLSWNWDRFLEYATKLKNSGKSIGFQIETNVNEEMLVFMPTLGRLANVQLVNANGTCGLRNQRWYDVLEKYIRQPLKNGIAEYRIDVAKVNNNQVIREFLSDRIRTKTFCLRQMRLKP
ncbi:hypothetical protein HK102_011571 [Quaeritorhiza haematococci]|nr:hypothetical protein HK102_011571 [Quaeritorhiza haematococci]